MAAYLTFQVNFHLNAPKSHHPAKSLHDYPHCQLVTGDNDAFALPAQSITISEILYSGNRTTVYAGTYYDGTEVALKFTSEEDVLAEAGVYDHLVGIQGTTIPRLHGVLYGDVQGGGDILCLVMERFGNSLDISFRSLYAIEK